MPKGSTPSRERTKIAVVAPDFQPIRDLGDTFIHRLNDGRIKISLLGHEGISSHLAFHELAKIANDLDERDFIKKLAALL